MKNLLIIFAIFSLVSCNQEQTKTESKTETQESPVTLFVLGTVQDAGSPQIGCIKACCAALFNHPDNQRKVVSLGLLDAENKSTYLFDASPDIATQMKYLTSKNTQNPSEIVDGIFLTHAHIGHYTGLMYLGKEAMDASGTKVYAMPRMVDFLHQNGPWDQLISRNNIALESIGNEKKIKLSGNLEVTPLLVPHRDEYSETVGFLIKGPNKTALYIPDIDKWEKWNHDILKVIEMVDFAFLDATFYSGEELNNRDMSEIPHPFVLESFQKFKSLSANQKRKIVFIHFNHTNPLLNENSEEYKEVIRQGFQIARFGDEFQL